VTRQWVLNASPIILLSKIGFLDFLLKLCPQPVVPRGVYEEILAGATDDPARYWLSQQGSQWIQPAKPIIPTIATWDLGIGETQVLSWCYDAPGYEAILDDGQARKCAKTFRILVRGTLGVVMLAKRENLIDSLEPYFAQLLTHGFRIDPKILDTALQWEKQLYSISTRGNEIMYKETIESFIQLLKQQPQLFSTEQRADLSKLLTPLTTLKDLSNAIADWCTKYPEIDRLLTPAIQQVTMGAGGTTSPKPTPEEEKKLKEDLIQIINMPKPGKSTTDSKTQKPLS
jgi:predicted nucleic acid-binding protein